MYAAASAGSFSCSTSHGSNGALAPARTDGLRRAGFVVREIVFGTLNIPLLGALVASTKQENDQLADASKVNAISRSPIDPQFHDARAYGSHVTEVADRDSGKSSLNACSRLSVAQPSQPINKGPFASSRLVVTKLHYCIL
jgi:hypothetical protein